MRKIAAHYIFCKQLYRMSYVELNKQDRFHKIQPLQEEIAGTEFYDGIIVIVPKDIELTTPLLEEWVVQYKTNNIFKLLEQTTIIANINVNDLVAVYLLHGLSLSAPEFSTNNGSSNCHIKRL